MTPLAAKHTDQGLPGNDDSKESDHHEQAVFVTSILLEEHIADGPVFTFYSAN